MNTSGRSLQLFFVDGRPDGMLTAEVFNWTGHVLRIPRTRLKDGLAREEAGFTGVYILIGEHEGAPLAYIGESEDLSSRLRNHATSKDWWEIAVLVTSAANNLHKAHVKYLESRLVEIADGTKAVQLDNGNIPPRSSLSEADQAHMESFLETLQMVLPAIRVDMFMDRSRDAGTEAAVLSDSDLPDTVFELTTPKHGITGTATLRNGEWIVLAGSRGKHAWTGNSQSNSHYYKLHHELIANGTLVIDGNHAVFTRDYAFSSPSAAAAILNGRSSNGQRAWKETSTGKQYRHWEADQLKVTP